MPIPAFFILFLIFIFYLNFQLRKGNKEAALKKKQYMEREIMASSVRKKSLDDINMITIQLENLPMKCGQTDEELTFFTDKITQLSTLPMASFAGLDNTDLKLQYGVGNLNQLIQYENTYQYALRLLVEWAEKLIEKDNDKDAVLVLEEGIRLETDLSQNYILLARLYRDTANYMKLNHLRSLIETRDIQRKDSVLEAIS